MRAVSSGAELDVFPGAGDSERLSGLAKIAKASSDVIAGFSWLGRGMESAFFSSPSCEAWYFAEVDGVW